MEEKTRNVFVVVTQCSEDSMEEILGVLREIAPNVISLNRSTFILSNEGAEGFPGNILFALDPLKDQTISVLICTVKGALGMSFGRDTDAAIKAMVGGL